MRPLFAFIVAVSILGGVKWFLTTVANQKNQATQIQERVVEDKFTLDVMLTFEAGPDPFGGSDATSLVVSRRGKQVINRTDVVPAGTPIEVEIEDIVEGKNEFLVTATASNNNPDLERALRIRILRNTEAIAEKWISSSPGEPVSGTVMIDIEPSTDEPHDH
jgi:hypothetical protein